MKTLILPLKSIYFDQIKSGAKLEEFRLCTPYWRKRLENRSYGFVTVTKGYPSRGDMERRMTFPWSGYVEKTIQHEFFGGEPVQVFAIKVSA
jgi:hypothetical protein